MNRRQFLRTAGGVAGATAAATAAGGNAAGVRGPSAPSVVTATGDTIEVIVGPTGDDGTPNFTFAPGTDEPLAITPGTTVNFVWESDNHNIVVESQPDGADWSGVEEIENTEFEHSHTFQTEGTYEYYCYPHRSAGMEATIIVSEEPSAVTPAGNTTVTGTPAANGTATDPGGSTGGGTTHSVDMTDGLVFDPDSLTIAPGDTVVFENVGQQGHSVTAYEDSIPEGAEYWASGGFDSEDAARGAYSATGSIEDSGNVPGGESWSHTFETEGLHEYFCIPHEASGMVGEIEVTTGGGEGGGGEGGGEEVDPEEMGVPFQAHWVGIATILGIILTLLLTFFFLKYGETPHSGYPEER